MIAYIATNWKVELAFGIGVIIGFVLCLLLQYREYRRKYRHLDVVSEDWIMKVGTMIDKDSNGEK